jgi:hypothetical protein
VLSEEKGSGVILKLGMSFKNRTYSKSLGVIMMICVLWAAGIGYGAYVMLLKLC